MTKTTETLARFVANLEYDTIPREVLERAKRQVLDVVGVALVGSRQPVGLLATKFVQRTGGTPESTVLGTSLRSSPPQAAFANGIFSHAIDYDDMWLPGAHPTGVIFPAALAMAEAVGASGRKLLVALVAGYEIMGKLHSLVSERRGWHPTPVFGTFGATAAAGKLLGCDSSTLQAAFGVSSSEASGIHQSGTMTKPFHSGHAARSGVVAAMLASDGMSANLDILDGGFFNTFFSGSTVSYWQATAQLGNPFHLISPGIGIKMYPSGYYLHHTFEAALELAKKLEIAAPDVSSIEVGVPRPGHFDRPVIRRGLEGKFSHQYHVTLAILDRKLTIESFSDERALAPDVQGFLKKVNIRLDRTIPANPDIAYWPVTVRLRNGKEATEAQPLPRSHWRYPLSRSDWVGKFMDNATRVLSRDEAERVMGLVEGLDELSDVRGLTEALAIRS